MISSGIDGANWPHLVQNLHGVDHPEESPCTTPAPDRSCFLESAGRISPIPNVSLEHSEIHGTEQNNIMRCKVSFALVQNLVKRTCNQAPMHAPVLE